MVLGKGREFKATVSISSKDGMEIPTPKKPTITKDSPIDVIKYDERVFEVPSDMIYYLADLPENLAARIQRANERGVDNISPDGMFGCVYCNHYSDNLASLLANMQEGEGVVVHNVEGTPGLNVSKCRYEQVHVLWATQFIRRASGKQYMARKAPCAIDESRIEILVEKGLLDEFEVKDREFAYPSLCELDNDPELRRKYEIKTSFWNSLCNRFRKRN